MKTWYALLLNRLETHEAWQNARLAGAEPEAEARLESEYRKACGRVNVAKAGGQGAL